jgi:phosphopantothenoylcysteine decarboxylase/phosphopantothenate--cysteine ligase
MGFAIAAELARRGATVTLISGPTAIDPPRVASTIRVRSAAQMHQAVMTEVGSADALVMAAAVANYTPEQVAAQKVAHDDEAWSVRLVPTVDILKDVAGWRSHEGRTSPLLIGFAAETHDVLARARAKRVRKGIDVIVANDVSRPDAGFDVDVNEVTIIGAGDDEHIPRGSKGAIASAIADRLARWLAERNAAEAGARA